MEEALARFIESPSRAATETLLSCSKEFVIVQARLWRGAGLAFVDRCREIMSELFLILVEDVIPGRAARPESLLAYLALRLRRLTRPRADRAIPLGLDTDLPEIGRCEFTPFRLDMVRGIVGAVRMALVSEAQPETRSLEFLFLHVHPEMAWGSRLLARADSKDPDFRMEVDKKRHQAFNRALRSRFDGIACGDWREISSWSAGERSHLAWKIIELSVAEASPLGAAELKALEIWRSDPHAAAIEPRQVASLLPHFLAAFAGVHRPKPALVAEPAAAYGAQPDEDVFAMLFRFAPPDTGKRVASPRADSLPLPEPGTSQEEDLAFGQALHEMLAWSQALLQESDPGTQNPPRAAKSARMKYPQG